MVVYVTVESSEGRLHMLMLMWIRYVLSVERKTKT
uniref:Uncharacterized protein n=1 Tax=Anguilla anguilla TaxID=7936 RepID=A0A0E9Q7F5_ANGAN